MLRNTLVFAFLISNFALAHPETNVGSATYNGQSKVSHDGDYIDFTIDFEASCYDDRQQARSQVITNLESFTRWLNDAKATYVGNIDYNVELINVWRHQNGQYGTEPCNSGYYASQQIKVRLKRQNYEYALAEGLIQTFFNDLQIAVGPLNYTESAELPTQATAKISSVRKGIYEETLDRLRRSAKAKAEKKATTDFLDFLGADYQGWWHIDSFEFNDSDYSEYYIPVSLGGQAGNFPRAMPGEESLSTIKLEPIKISVESKIVFHFLKKDHYLPAAQ